MLKDIKLAIDFVNELSSNIYGKEVFFYDFDDDTWYSRDHCRNVTFEEITEWLKERIYPCFYDDCCEDETYIIKYKSENTNGEWKYHEAHTEEEFIDFLDRIKMETGIEYETFKKCNEV